MTLQFAYTDEQNDIFSGPSLIANDHCLKELEEEHGEDVTDIAACKEFLTSRKQSSWVFLFKEIINEPLDMYKETTFDDLWDG